MKLREITTHVVAGDEPRVQLKVVAMIPAGSKSQYSTKYRILGQIVGSAYCGVNFQEGTIHENGVNGISLEALLAIIIDRLEGFQAGHLPCEANAFALSDCRNALAQLQSRTRDRLARGVAGEYKP